MSGGVEPSVLLCGLGIDTMSMLTDDGPLSGRSLIALVDDPTSLSSHAVDVAARFDVQVVSSAEAGTVLADRDIDLVLRSPGFPVRHPALAALRDGGVSSTTPLGYWLGLHGSDYTTIGITGTKGKSTTTALVEATLVAMGSAVVVGGNIGTPIWDRRGDIRPETIVVLEVSSYMASDIAAVPRFGVLTSLDADHVSWHGSLEAYRRDKLRLFGADDRACRVVVPAHEQVAIDALVAAGHHPILVDGAAESFAPGVDLLVERGFPPHVGSNFALAVAVAQMAASAECTPDQQRQVAGAFSSLPSRHNTIAQRNGIRWIDDALASNPMATAIALDAVKEPDCVLIVGGTARDVELAVVTAAAKRRAGGRMVVISLPDNGNDIAAAVLAGRADAVVQSADSVDDAVRIAAQTVEEGSFGPTAVLFAPGAPTPVRFGTYIDRAADFAAAVRALPVRG